MKKKKMKNMRVYKLKKLISVNEYSKQKKKKEEEKKKTIRRDDDE